MYIQSEQAESLYDALFDWQAPLSLWEKAEKLKNILGYEVLASRDVGRMDVKRILEGWVIGKTLTMAYHGEPCLVRVADVTSLDGQLYRGRRLHGVEVTQALYPGRRRNVCGVLPSEHASPMPLLSHEEEIYLKYRDNFFRQVFHQIEARIDHKFNLYNSIGYLLLYVDMFDATNPRYSHFAFRDFAEECADDLEYRLHKRFYNQWNEKIGHLFLLDDKKERFVTRFGEVPAFMQAQPMITV